LKQSSSASEKFDPTDNQVMSFELLRAALSDVAEQAFIDPASNCFIVRSDASKVAIGAVLIQLVGERQNTIQFYSRKLKDAETRYSTFDRELLAAHDAIAYFLRYIDGQSVTLFTDHQPLVSAFHKKSDCQSDRQCRQFSFSSEHLTAIEYLKGNENVVADFLSRAEPVEAIHLDLFDFEALSSEQQTDPEIVQLTAGKKNFQTVKWNEKDIICETSDSRLRPVIPTKFRKSAFQQLHCIGLPG